MNKKIAYTLSFIGLTLTSLTTLSIINKAVDQLAISKELLDKHNKELYHWRFGDISYSVSGEGKPVLLIHNLKEDSSSIEWNKIIPVLSRSHTVYVIDLLGCGLSERPSITYTSYLYTQLINDFIHNIIKKKTSVIATGKSASFILGACNDNKEAYDELILINPDSIHSLKKTPSKRTKTAEFILKTPIIGTFIYHLKTSRKKILQSFEEHYFYDQESIPESFVDYYFESAHLTARKAKNLYASLVGKYTNANIIRTLKNINQNIHILASREIPNMESTIKEYQYYNPAIEVEYIDYTRLLPQLEAPEEVLKYIQLYLYHK